MSTHFCQRHSKKKPCSVCKMEDQFNKVLKMDKYKFLNPFPEDE